MHEPVQPGSRCHWCGDDVLGLWDVYGSDARPHSVEIGWVGCCDNGKAEITQSFHDPRTWAHTLRMALGFKPEAFTVSGGPWQRHIFERIDDWHHHHWRPVGWKFGAVVQLLPGCTVAAAVVGRPVSRVLDDGKTLEVTRVACCEDYWARRNAVSMLTGRIKKQARAQGAQRLVTYTLAGIEDGRSLRACGWTLDGQVKGRSWSTPSRPRNNKGKTPLHKQDKQRWILQIKKQARHPVPT